MTSCSVCLRFQPTHFHDRNNIATTHMKFFSAFQAHSMNVWVLCYVLRIMSFASNPTPYTTQRKKNVNSYVIYWKFICHSICVEQIENIWMTFHNMIKMQLWTENDGFDTKSFIKLIDQHHFYSHLISIKVILRDKMVKILWALVSRQWNWLRWNRKKKKNRSESVTIFGCGLLCLMAIFRIFIEFCCFSLSCSFNFGDLQHTLAGKIIVNTVISYSPNIQRLFDNSISNFVRHATTFVHYATLFGHTVCGIK